MAFWYFLLTLTVIAMLGPGLLNGMLAIALVNVPFFARIIRGSTLTLRESDFVLAAKGMCVGHTRILFRHILLNSLSTLVVATTINLGFMITAAAALSFLGLGVHPPHRTGARCWPAGGSTCQRRPTHHICLAWPFSSLCWGSTCWAMGCATRLIPVCESHDGNTSRPT